MPPGKPRQQPRLLAGGAKVCVPAFALFKLLAQSGASLVNIDSRGFIVGRSLDLHVRKAAHRARFVQLEGTGFFNTLREKLGWGMDVRSAKMSER